MSALRMLVHSTARFNEKAISNQHAAKYENTIFLLSYKSFELKLCRVLDLTVKLQSEHV